MPAWVGDESVWAKAKEEAKKQKDESDPGFWGYVTAIYKKMGGSIKKSMSVRNDHPFTVAVDFDGVISQYDGYRGRGVFGDPMPGVKQALDMFKRLGCLVIIFTTRDENESITEYLKSHEIWFDFINKNPYQYAGTSGKVMADVYIDDRAIRFIDWYSTALQVVGLIAKEGLSDIDAAMDEE